MTEANFDLQLLWPSYQSQEQVYVFIVQQVLCTISGTAIATLGAVTEFNKVCIHFEEKSAVHLPR